MLSQSGKHFSRPADAMRADIQPPSMDGDMGDENDAQEIVIQKKADGTFCTIEDGQETEHPDFDSALSSVQESFGQDSDSPSDGGEEQY